MATKTIVPKQYNFRTALTPGATAKMTVASEVTGTIKEVTMHWPRGCNALVDLAFGISGDKDEWLMPSSRETYLALNDATPIFKLDYKNLRRDDVLWVEMRNRDAVNTHTPSVIADCEGYEAPEWR